MADHRLELIRPAPAALSAALPQWARVVEESLSMLSSMSEEVVPVLLHRDFHLRQCLADNERVGVVDWDLFAAGDPAFDVAYFTTYLETHGLGTGLADAFLAGYAHGGGPEVEPRLGAYRGFNLLRRACRRFRLHDAGWEREMSRMLASLETALP